MRRAPLVGGELIEKNRGEVEHVAAGVAGSEGVHQGQILAGGVQQYPRRMDDAVGCAVLGLVQVPQEGQLCHAQPNHVAVQRRMPLINLPCRNGLE